MLNKNVLINCRVYTIYFLMMYLEIGYAIKLFYSKLNIIKFEYKALKILCSD